MSGPFPYGDERFEQPTGWFQLSDGGTSIPIFRGPQETPQGSGFNESDHLEGRYDIRRAVSESYNCHGLTFASRHGWVGTLPRLIAGDVDSLRNMPVQRGSDYVEHILQSGTFRQIARLGDFHQRDFDEAPKAHIGDVVIYRMVYELLEEVAHSGIIISTDWCPPGQMSTTPAFKDKILVLSKLGAGSECFHSIGGVKPDCYGTIVEIWTDRPEHKLQISTGAKSVVRAF
jgi:hypothetical protein